MAILENYIQNTEEIESIFKTSQTLKELYLGNLKALLKDENLTRTQRNNLLKNIQSLSSISIKSIEISEEIAWSRLFSQGFLLIVSLSEQILKEVFESLLSENLEKVNGLDGKTIKLEELSKRNYQLSRDDCFEIVRERLFEEDNPEQKITFQNVRTIEGIFKGYFALDLNVPQSLSKKLHLYYQVRHVLIHNAGFADRRFIENLKKADIEHSYGLSEKIIIDKTLYNDCKKTFQRFFELLEAIITNSELKYLSD